MGEVRVGTCSWTDKSLLASRWYPEGAKDAAGRLKYYSSIFDVVEVDSTFYAIPDESKIYNWIARTPPHFKFNIKAYGLFTFHSVNWSTLPPWARKEIESDKDRRIKFSDIPKVIRFEIWKNFEKAILPLQKTGKMGYLLFQIPPWAAYSERMIRYMRRVAEVASDFRIAVEVRNSSWLAEGNRDKFLDLLREFNIAYVVVDEPELDWTVRPELNITATWGTVVRFHGRNSEAWSRKNVSVQEKFKYLYKESELIPWKNSLYSISSQIGTVYAMFNNCFRNNAVVNAEQFKQMLGIKTPVLKGQQKDLGL